MSISNQYERYKRYVFSDSGYRLCSQWTSSNTVHFDDGKTAQEKLGAIDGITDSLNSSSSNVALSAKSGKNLQDQITALNTGLGGWSVYPNELTQDEYDELPEETKSTPKLIFIIRKE